MSNIPISSFCVAWADASVNVVALADFFADNISPAYISHSEIQFGRAISPTTWSPQLRENVRQELSEKSFGPPSVERPNSVAIGWLDGRVVALSIIGCQFDAPTPFATVEDVVVDESLRGHSIGSKLLSWIEADLKKQGIQRLFLESGVSNESAHHFFERLGFHQCSIVIMKELFP